MIDVLVIGDQITDQYINGVSHRMSPEAPVPVILNPLDYSLPGGALNVARNLEALGSKCEFHTNTANIAVKTRIVANGHILARIDHEEYVPYILPHIDYAKYKYVVISDYNKGTCHYANDIIRAARSWGIQVFVDPKRTWWNYTNAFLIKANLSEFEAALGEPWKKDDWKACEKVCNTFKIENLVVTMGAKGMFLYGSNIGGGYYFHNKPLAVRDVTGAGDVVLAAIVHYFNKAGGHDNDLVQACNFANKLAGISVQNFGTYTLNSEDIQKVEQGLV